MADVRFDHVSKRYGENAFVIRDLNLEIHDHEFLVLVGPSGCGKSTALRMIAGLEEISEGDLYIGGVRVNDVAPKDRDIAMVFQNYALYPHMNVFDNMAFSLKLRGTPKAEIETQVHKAADMLGIGDYLMRKPKALSGGQRQRVALGRALVRDPKVFLLDEPLSNLDAKLRVQTRTEISRLHQATQTTFVYVTHDQVEAMTMGDRIAVLNAGIIQQLGTPQDLYDTPANLFVAGFIGSPAMDFFEGRLVKDEGGASVVIGSGSEAYTLRLTGGAAEQLSGQATKDGRPVVMGIRPEHFSMADAESNAAGNTISGVVDVVEHLGNEQLIYVRLPGAVVPETVKAAKEQAPDTDSGGGAAVAVAAPDSTARLSPSVRVSPGEQVTLAVDTSKVHLFDPATTNRFV
ncbi:MAG TPA: sn-glycerol-3-phosphate ABC transporter ATP-binding protein UgpC [Ktedonobacterales bacterium]|nr:sn-glycerol-3-phosphate ABC transporter ATP-binding protein UgpC [Ktedonobacterales bacterium]